MTQRRSSASLLLLALLLAAACGGRRRTSDEGATYRPPHPDRRAWARYLGVQPEGSSLASQWRRPAERWGEPWRMPPALNQRGYSDRSPRGESYRAAAASPDALLPPADDRARRLQVEWHRPWTERRWGANYQMQRYGAAQSYRDRSAPPPSPPPPAGSWDLSRRLLGVERRPLPASPARLEEARRGLPPARRASSFPRPGPREWDLAPEPRPGAGAGAEVLVTGLQGPRVHAGHAVVRAEAGFLRVRMDGKAYLLGPDDVVGIPPGRQYTLETAGARPSRARVLLSTAEQENLVHSPRVAGPGDALVPDWSTALRRVLLEPRTTSGRPARSPEPRNRRRRGRDSRH